MKHGVVWERAVRLRINSEVVSSIRGNGRFISTGDVPDLLAQAPQTENPVQQHSLISLKYNHP